MIKYRTFLNQIEAIDVAGETASLIITQQSRREQKRSDLINWHDTWEAAKLFLVEIAEKKVNKLQNALYLEQSNLEYIKAMTKDDK